jgi:hypothetical protein
MLDTSDSTQEKLPQIQRAAIAFLEQLGPQDKVKVISFNGEINDLTDFTSNKSVLRNAILQTKSGHDTRVYDAVQLALNSLRPIQQRKAIVILLTEWIGWRSATYKPRFAIWTKAESSSINPLRGRADTERMARQRRLRAVE